MSPWLNILWRTTCLMNDGSQERGIRFSAEDMLSTIQPMQKQGQDTTALDIEDDWKADVPCYVAGRSYSHLGKSQP